MKFIYIVLFIIIFNACNNDKKQINIIENNSTANNTNSEEINPLFTEQWYINHNTLFYAQNDIDTNAHINTSNILESYTGKGVRIAIIDDGFDINHPEIKDNIVATISVDEYGNVLGNNVEHTDTSDMHGTAISGIIASKDNDIGLRGIAPDVELILIKMPFEQSPTDSSIIEVFNQAINLNADIINCSWGTNDVSDIVKEHIESISNSGRNGKGTIIVFAAGNYNINIKNDESSISTVISVGATDKDNLRTEYSNFGKSLDIMAPGGDYLGITTIDPMGSFGASEDEYNRYNETKNSQKVSFIGTSASAPIVSAVLALALEKNNNISREELQNKLKYSTSLIGLNTPYIDDMISSSTTTPTITGLLGSLNNDKIEVRFTNESSLKIYGPYKISLNGDNTFFSTATDNIPEGNYQIELITKSDPFIIYAVDENFEINSSKSNKSNKEIKKNNFYGYGKIDLIKLMHNIK
jgi:subtilisin family serine protease